MDTKLTALGAYRIGKLRLPPGYRISCDDEVLTLYRHDGSARTAEEVYRTHGKSSA